MGDMAHFRKLKTDYLLHQIDRLQWAADTTDDGLWRKAHLRQKAIFESIVAERVHSPSPKNNPTQVATEEGRT